MTWHHATLLIFFCPRHPSSPAPAQKVTFAQAGTANQHVLPGYDLHLPHPDGSRTCRRYQGDTTGLSDELIPRDVHAVMAPSERRV